MGSLVRVSLNRLIATNGTKVLFAQKNGTIIRTITSQLKDLPEKPKPWPYQQKSFTLLNYFFDKTTSRFDENSKIIVVEGPIAAGKSALAKEIASAFNMLYLPEANLDMVYINKYGYDLRKLDPLLPESCRSFDVMDFLRNPKHRSSIRMQIEHYVVRLSQYVDALAHILSTGQGIVLDRCVYSDFVFAEAMFSQGFISKLARKKYFEFRDNTLPELLKPHLIVYLDVPVPKVLENIKKRNISYERNSPVLTPQYLQAMEKNYKQNYLPEISKHAELLIYDWSEQGEVEIVVEDIERIDFNRFDDHDTQMKDWKLNMEEEWACLRHRYADKKQSVMKYLNVPAYEVPELIVDALEADTYHKVMAEAPGEEFEYGYNRAVGDDSWLFKTSVPHRDTLPLTERRTVA